MYDVIYIDAHGDETPVAQHLLDRGAAAELAKQDGGRARRRADDAARLEQAAQLRLRRPRAVPEAA